MTSIEIGRVMVAVVRRLSAGVILALAAFSLVAVIAASEGRISASILRADIARDGAVTVLWKKLWPTAETPGGDWDQVLAGIEDGRQEWLSVAVDLAPASDAGASEQLSAAVAIALAQNASGVLALTGRPIFGINQTCGYPGDEIFERQVHAWRSRALAAVDRVSDPKLAVIRKKCRDVLVSVNPKSCHAVPDNQSLGFEACVYLKNYVPWFFGRKPASLRGMTSDPLTTEERALFGAYDVAADLAKRCRQLRELNVSVSGAALDMVVNCLMTECWDQHFSQTEIRNAFLAALEDMNRYAAGEERR